MILKISLKEKSGHSVDFLKGPRHVKTIQQVSLFTQNFSCGDIDFNAQEIQHARPRIVHSTRSAELSHVPFDDAPDGVSSHVFSHASPDAVVSVPADGQPVSVSTAGTDAAGTITACADGDDPVTD
jgi:hypothetical protein